MADLNLKVIVLDGDLAGLTTHGMHAVSCCPAPSECADFWESDVDGKHAH